MRRVIHHEAGRRDRAAASSRVRCWLGGETAALSVYARSHLTDFGAPQAAGPDTDANGPLSVGADFLAVVRAILDGQAARVVSAVADVPDPVVGTTTATGVEWVVIGAMAPTAIVIDSNVVGTAARATAVVHNDIVIDTFVYDVFGAVKTRTGERVARKLAKHGVTSHLDQVLAKKQLLRA